MPRGASAVVTAAAATAVTACLVLYPDLAFSSALRGLRVWWDVVFPALLPFFIAGQVLLALGAVHFLGVLLEGCMRPLFNVPGVGAFVVAMGLASGYPIGAVLTARLHRDGQLTTAEAERLVSFCNTADPLFMAGAVAVGMFGDPALGGLIMACHYLAALGTGLLWRFHRAGLDRPRRASAAAGGTILQRAARALIEARERDGRPLGQVLGDSVRDSVQTLLMVGGFIILAAVLIDLLSRLGAVSVAASALTWALRPLGVDASAARALVSGLVEITIGTKAASAAASPLLVRLAVANAIIAWSGLSVFAQVAAIVQGTGVRMGPYILARFVQAALAAGLTFLFWNPSWRGATRAVPAVAGQGGGLTLGGLLSHLSWIAALRGSTLLLAGVLAVGVVGVVVFAAAQGTVLTGFRVGHARRRG